MAGREIPPPRVNNDAASLSSSMSRMIPLRSAGGEVATIEISARDDERIISRRPNREYHRHGSAQKIRHFTSNQKHEMA